MSSTIPAQPTDWPAQGDKQSYEQTRRDITTRDWKACLDKHAVPVQDSPRMYEDLAIISAISSAANMSPYQFYSKSEASEDDLDPIQEAKKQVYDIQIQTVGVNKEKYYRDVINALSKCDNGEESTKVINLKEFKTYSEASLCVHVCRMWEEIISGDLFLHLIASKFDSSFDQTRSDLNQTRPQEFKDGKYDLNPVGIQRQIQSTKAQVDDTFKALINHFKKDKPDISSADDTLLFHFASNGLTDCLSMLDIYHYLVDMMQEYNRLFMFKLFETKVIENDDKVHVLLPFDYYDYDSVMMFMRRQIFELCKCTFICVHLPMFFEDLICRVRDFEFEPPEVQEIYKTIVRPGLEEQYAKLKTAGMKESEIVDRGSDFIIKLIDESECEASENMTPSERDAKAIKDGKVPPSFRSKAITQMMRLRPFEEAKRITERRGTLIRNKQSVDKKSTAKYCRSAILMMEDVLFFSLHGHTMLLFQISTGLTCGNWFLTRDIEGKGKFYGNKVLGMLSSEYFNEDELSVLEAACNGEYHVPRMSLIRELLVPVLECVSTEFQKTVQEKVDLYLEKESELVFEKGSRSKWLLTHAYRMRVKSLYTDILDIDVDYRVYLMRFVIALCFAGMGITKMAENSKDPDYKTKLREGQVEREENSPHSPPYSPADENAEYDIIEGTMSTRKK